MCSPPGTGLLRVRAAALALDDPLSAATWAELAAAVPALAVFGEAKLGIPPAYLATVREDGVPRVHPITPIVGGGHLFVFMEPASPKGRDLRERAWFALHNGVSDTAGSGGEFLITGCARLVADDDLRSIAVRSASYEPADRYILFELMVTEARCNGYGDVTLPSPSCWSVVASPIETR